MQKRNYGIFVNFMDLRHQKSMPTNFHVHSTIITTMTVCSLSLFWPKMTSKLWTFVFGAYFCPKWRNFGPKWRHKAEKGNQWSLENAMQTSFMGIHKHITTKIHTIYSSREKIGGHNVTHKWRSLKRPM